MVQVCHPAAKVESDLMTANEAVRALQQMTHLDSVGTILLETGRHALEMSRKMADITKTNTDHKQRKQADQAREMQLRDTLNNTRQSNRKTINDLRNELSLSKARAATLDRQLMQQEKQHQETVTHLRSQVADLKQQLASMDKEAKLAYLKGRKDSDLRAQSLQKQLNTLRG